MLQNALKRNLVLIVCLFHAVEKVMQHLFLHWEGKKTKSPKYDGPVGRNFMNGLELKDIVNFMPVFGNVQNYAEDFVNSMNHDLQLLYRLCLAIQSGHFPGNLANLKPGKCHQAR